MTREEALAELGQMIGLKQKLDDEPNLIENCILEADRQLGSTPEREQWRRLDTIREVLLWETCARCEKDFRYPHLCREHRYCGSCHPPVGGR